MSKEKKELIKYRLHRAGETLEDAKILFAKNKLFSTVNRIYYAMFYIVGGLLLTKDLGSSKHSGVLGLFNKEFVRRGIVDKELGKFYNEMFGFRQKADYRDLVEFKEEDVRIWLSRAEEFVFELSRLVNTLSSKEK